MLKTIFKLFVVSTISVSVLSAQSDPAIIKTDGSSARTPASSYRFPENGMTKQSERYYRMIWGVDSFTAKTVESGELVRFAYRILDPDKAKLINDKKFEPTLVDQQAGIKLVVPSLEKVGQLRQSSTPIAGMSYWMAFSNQGRRVRRGDHVSVLIGNFHVDGLIVQ